MRLLTTIHDTTDTKLAELIKNMKPRVAVRAVMLDGNALAVLNVTRDGYHKLPGGGVEGSESLHKALEREVLEEVGCEIEVITEIGQVNDYRDEWGFYQESFCYLAKVVAKGLPTAMTENELAAGFEAMWLPSVTKAISVFEQDKPTAYEGVFIQRRDLVILKEAQKLLLSS